MNTNQQAVQILADSFLHYPLMRFAFDTTDAHRSVLLQKLFNKSVAAASMFGGVLVSNDGHAALIWQTGKCFPLTLWNELFAGM
ncbi:MAG: hypothetical protein V4615_13385, partial [Bacteroidota bacterium]